MKLEIFLFLIWLSLINAYNAKNVDTQDVIVLQKSGGGKNQFGHSVALVKDHIYVGAPLDNTHGNVFKCKFNAFDLNKQNPSCQTVNGKQYFAPG